MSAGDVETVASCCLGDDVATNSITVVGAVFRGCLSAGQPFPSVWCYRSAAVFNKGFEIVEVTADACIEPDFAGGGADNHWIGWISKIGCDGRARADEVVGGSASAVADLGPRGQISRNFNVIFFSRNGWPADFKTVGVKFGTYRGKQAAIGI